MPNVNAEQWARLQEPFPPEQIHYKPDNRGNQLAYVGHAEVTERLNEVDPTWTWSPAIVDGVPKITRRGTDEKPVAELWGTMTVLGVTRPAVGTCSADAWSGEVSKELCSDLIRNGAMRFGVALDLWKRTGAAPQLQTNQAAPQPQASGAAGAVAGKAAQINESGGALLSDGQSRNLYRLWHHKLNYTKEQYLEAIFIATGQQITDDRGLTMRDAGRVISHLKELAGETDEAGSFSAPPADQAPPPNDNQFAAFDESEQPFEPF